MLAISLFLFLSNEGHMVLGLVPFSVVKHQVSPEILVVELAREVWLCLRDVDHQVFSHSLCDNELLTQFFKHFIKGFDTLANTFLLNIKVVDDTALELSELGALTVLVPDKQVLSGFFGCRNLIEEFWHLAHFPATITAAILHHLFF